MPIRPFRTCLFVMLAAAPAAAEAPPAWAWPEEVLAAETSRSPWPVEVVRGASGAAGVFVFEPEGGLTLRVSKDGRAPWKVLILPNGPAGEPVVDGDRVEILLADADDKSASLGTFDLKEGRDVSRVRLPGAFRETPAFSRLAARGPDRFALFSTPGGDVFFSQTEDAGKKWKPPAKAGRTAARGDSCCPPLLLADDGPHLLFVEEGGRIVHRVAGADGASWQDRDPVPPPRAEDGRPTALAGAQNGKQFHLALMTDRIRFLYAWSDDAGAHWAPWTVLASPTRDELAMFDIAATFRLKARGKTVAFTWTGRGEKDNDPCFCHFLVSRSSGGTWAPFNPAAGVRGSTGLAAAFVAEDGSVSAAFAAAPGVTKGKRYVLFRQAGKTGVGEEPGAEWWGK